MAERWRLRPRERPDGRVVWQVIDGEDRDRPVATFDDQAAAQAHARRLAEGPFDWDEQQAWQDDEDDDEDGWGDRGW